MCRALLCYEEIQRVLSRRIGKARLLHMHELNKDYFSSGKHSHKNVLLLPTGLQDGNKCQKSHSSSRSSNLQRHDHYGPKGA